MQGQADKQAKSNEWYTPSRYIEAAREVMSGIDLDPASCALANQTVKAARYYTKDENGLAQPWYGRVWLNPPYNKEEGISLKHWVRKICHEYETGNIQQGILLTPVPMRWCLWFYELWDYVICFPRKRIHFYSYQTRKDHANIAYCVVYLGPNEQKFIETFSQFGTIAKRVSVPHKEAVPLSMWDTGTQEVEVRDGVKPIE